MSFCQKLNQNFIVKDQYDLGECWRYPIFPQLLFIFILIMATIKYIKLRSSKSVPFKSAKKLHKIILIIFIIQFFTSFSFYLFKIITIEDVIPISLIMSLILNQLMYVTLILCFILEMTKDCDSPGFTIFWFVFLDLFRTAWILKGHIQSIYSVGIDKQVTELVIIIVNLCVTLSVFILVISTERKFGQNTFTEINEEDIESKPKSLSLKSRSKPSKKRKKYLKSEGFASIFSKLTFNWVTPLLLKAFQSELNNDDFFENTKSMKVKEISTKFKKNLEKTKRKVLNKMIFVRLLISTFGKEFAFCALYKLLNDLIIFANPLLLGNIINYINNKVESTNNWLGYFYAALMFVSSLIQAFLLNHYFDKGYRVGIKIKIFLMNYLYEKSLRINRYNSHSQTTGEIVNLMAVDSTSFLDLLPFINMVWSGPLQISIGMYLLYRQIGASSFVGLGIMLLFMIPGNTILVRKMKQIQKNIMEQKDLRIKMTNEVLSSMKIIKLYAWENGFKEKINAIRNEELKHLKNYAYLNCLSITIWGTSAVFVSLGAFITYTKTGGVLTAEKAFISISLLGIIRFPLGMLPNVINSSIVALVSLKRFIRFLNSDEVKPNKFDEKKFNISEEPSSVNELEGIDLVIKDADFFWNSQKTKKALSVKTGTDGKSLSKIMIKKGETIMVVGPVGSGKSAFLSALLGELVQDDGDIKVERDVAYIAQTSWIQNATIRDNILYGCSYDRNWYRTVIKGCCLEKDLKTIKGGEFAEIGERGINLSGGQKQRVALARAIYSKKRLYLIDDVLSALDPYVAQKIMKNCLMGLLRKQTIVFSTNSVQFLKNADKIIVISNGTIKKVCDYSELKEDSEYLHLKDKMEEASATQNEIRRKSETLESFTDDKTTIIENKQEIESSLVDSELSRMSFVMSELSVDEKLNKNEMEEKKDGKLISIEDKKSGKIKWKIYKHYFLSYGGPILISIIILTYLLRQGSDYGAKLYLAFWSDKNDKAKLQGNTSHLMNLNYVWYFSLISLGSVAIISLNVLMHTFGYLIASERVSNNLLQSVIRAPMSFYDTTPRGRILNRFSSDIRAVDMAIPRSVLHFFTCFCEVIAIMIIITATTYWFALALIPLFVIYYFIQKYFIKPSREIKRIGSILLSPIYSCFQETLDGIQTIRAFKSQNRFKKNNENMIDNWSKVVLMNFMTNRWLSLRLEAMGSLVTVISASLIVFQREKLSGGFAGLALSYSLRFVGSLNWMIRSAVMLESQVVSIERIKEYTDLIPEAASVIPENDPYDKWPEKGEIKITNLKMKYRPELNYVLNGINCDINSNEKIGIVGRTGAGKSSLFNCIFRINEASGGSICIDGVDISKIGLHTLRSKLTIIPQDPVIFGGTIRLNLDPPGTTTDEEIWKALELCKIKKMVESFENKGKSGLDFETTENGSNLSAGERQLLCITRALLRRSKILLLDEATSSIDFATDKQIQDTIREAFKEVTVLTIAHRLDTVMNSDRIIVMDAGKVIESGSPKKLLDDVDSVFSSIVKGGEKELE